MKTKTWLVAVATGALGLVLIAAATLGKKGNESSMKQIRTYMAYTTPVDPARIVTMPDMDLSYALAATLTEWSPTKQPTGGLASSWSVVSDSVFRFVLRQGISWSDGTRLTCGDVKRSFERSLKAYPTDLRSLGAYLERIECGPDNSVDFHLKASAKDFNLLGKLTEPNYGVLRVNSEGRIDLSVSVGPFYLKKASPDELVLGANRNWKNYASEMPEEVVIRKPPAGMNPQTVLLENEWPNLSETSSLLPETTLDNYRKGRYSVWKRPFDKVTVLSLGKGLSNRDGVALTRLLREKIQIAQVTEGLSGFAHAAQMFPEGFHLYDSKFTCPTKDESIPETYRKRPLTVITSLTGLPESVRKSVRSEIERITGIAPRFIEDRLDALEKYFVSGDYDLYLGAVGLADPDPEGIMSFFFEGDAALIPSTKEENFVHRLDESRKETDAVRRLALMRRILSDSICQGHVLPLFHLSTLGIGREGVDLGHIPLSDESVTLSKIRMK